MGEEVGERERRKEEGVELWRVIERETASSLGFMLRTGF